LQSEADARGEVDWDLHFVDATVIRAHQHAAGARQTRTVGDGANVEALGRSQGGFSTKLHLRAEGGGKPIVAVLTGGERHEQIALEALLDNGAIRRASRGRSRLRPRRVAGDCCATIWVKAVLPHPGMLPSRRVLPHWNAPVAS